MILMEEDEILSIYHKFLPLIERDESAQKLLFARRDFVLEYKEALLLERIWEAFMLPDASLTTDEDLRKLK